MWGSSPLARGLRVGDLSGPDRRRIIPARAGFTQDQCASAGPKPDHPRSRGVYGAGRINIPPHTGIIPARAGFTLRLAETPRSSGDHPRSREVYKFGMRAAIARTGSSPLARGLRAWHHPSGHVVGIIPARAGFTPHSSISCMPAKDHPRSRGVYHLIPQLSDHRLGSSPLARGLPPHESRSLWTGRIIPARAGFTPGGSGSMTPTEDHPRSRGVYSHVVSCGVEAGGSSPLARGLPGARVVGPRAERIIPARAGFTAATPST